MHILSIYVCIYSMTVTIFFLIPNIFSINQSGISVYFVTKIVKHVRF